MQDYAVIQDNYGEFDIQPDSTTKLFKTVDGFETALSAQIFLNRRADKNEIANPILRGGWMGDLYWKNQGYEIGSLLHIKFQSRNTSNDNNQAISLVNDAMDYFIKLGALKKVQTQLINGTINISMITDNNILAKYNKLWKKTNG
jgi:phage gp46-like protein